MKHKCPVDGCAALVPNSMLMCSHHWRRVPGPLQAAVWREYRKGAGSEPHLAACQAATEAVDQIINEEAA